MFYPASITPGDVFDEERNDKGKIQAFSFYSRIRWSKLEFSLWLELSSGLTHK